MVGLHCISVAVEDIQVLLGRYWKLELILESRQEKVLECVVVGYIIVSLLLPFSGHSSYDVARDFQQWSILEMLESRYSARVLVHPVLLIYVTHYILT